MTKPQLCAGGAKSIERKRREVERGKRKRERERERESELRERERERERGGLVPSSHHSHPFTVKRFIH